MLKWKVGKVSVGTTATEIVADRAGRRSLKVWGFPTTGGTIVYVKQDNSVSTSDMNPGQPTGAPAAPGGVLSLETEGSVWGITGSGSRDISFLETYEE